MKRSEHGTVDALLVGASILLALVFAQLDIAAYLLGFPRGLEALAIFIAGVCFVSVFTVVPATIVLGQLATQNSLPLVALLGGVGALSGDFVIFKLFRDRTGDDLRYLLSLAPQKRLSHALNSRLTRWVSTALGALIIASPLPDELGLAMLGIAKINTWVFVPLSFLLNTGGILVIGLVARALHT